MRRQADVIICLGSIIEDLERREKLGKKNSVIGKNPEYWRGIETQSADTIGRLNRFKSEYLLFIGQGA